MPPFLKLYSYLNGHGRFADGRIATIRMVLKPFSLTYILYDEEDGLFGWLMALMSLAPV